MAITFDAQSGSNSGGASATLAFNHTIGSGSNRLLVVGIAVETNNNPSPNPTSVTYDGTGMTGPIRSDTAGGTGINETTFLYYMLDTDLPSTGTYSISITLPASQREICAGGISVAGALQQAPEANNGTSTTTSGATVSQSITTVTDGAWVFDVVGSGNAINFTPTSPQVERWDQAATTSAGAGSSREVTTAGSVTQEWTFDASSNRDALSIAAFAMAPSVTYKIEGVTKDLAGSPLGSCDTFLVKDNGDNTYTFVEYQLSDVSTGAYSFTGLADNDPNYQVIAYKNGSPNVYDVTDHVITPELET